MKPKLQWKDDFTHGFYRSRFVMNEWQNHGLLIEQVKPNPNMVDIKGRYGKFEIFLETDECVEYLTGDLSNTMIEAQLLAEDICKKLFAPLFEED